MSSRYGGSSTSAVGEVEREDADRDVDEEDPAPAVVVDDPAADGGADGRGEDDGHAVDGEGHAALLRGEGVGEDGLLAGLQAAAGRALQDAEEDQHAERGGQAAEQRGEGEEEDAGHVEALAAHAVGDPSADGEDNGVGDQVAGEHPGGFVAAGGERAGDVPHGHVGDGAVERLHEGGQGHRNGDDPGIGAGTPGVVEGKSGCRRGQNEPLDFLEQNQSPGQFRARSPLPDGRIDFDSLLPGYIYSGFAVIGACGQPCIFRTFLLDERTHHMPWGRIARSGRERALYHRVNPPAPKNAYV